MEGFGGKVAWITGATSGIGRACALELAERGADVALSGRRRERLDEVAAEVVARGVRALALPCDVREEPQIEAAVGRIVESFGRLDVVLANAGFSVGGRIEELSGDDWRRQLDTNVVGAALTARHALGELHKTSGRLALVGSVSGFIVAPGYAAYHCSKHALRALGLTLAVELAGSGVSCTTVHPGFVDSEIQKVDRHGVYRPEREDRRPALLMWSAERAARVIVDAIAARKCEVVFTGHGKLAAAVGMHAPWLLQAIMSLGALRDRAASIRIDEP
jgi:NAD(P)-dependent dehydrogenase (short-subunit alcohol dehydrogenase family)